MSHPQPWIRTGAQGSQGASKKPEVNQEEISFGSGDRGVPPPTKQEAPSQPLPPASALSMLVFHRSTLEAQ